MLTTEQADSRVGEVAWVCTHVHDLVADFAALYGEPDMLALPSRRWLRMASRLPAYDGVMRARIEGMTASPPEPTAPQQATAAPAVVERRQPSGDIVREIPATRDALAKSGLASVIEMS